MRSFVVSCAFNRIRSAGRAHTEASIKNINTQIGNPRLLGVKRCIDATYEFILTESPKYHENRIDPESGIAANQDLENFQS